MSDAPEPLSIEQEAALREAAIKEKLRENAAKARAARWPKRDEVLEEPLEMNVPTLTAAEQKRVDAARAAAECHPLFPLKLNEKIPPIAWITVSKNELPNPANPYGLPVTIPQNIPAAELQSVEDLAQRWGGGTYVLMGRMANNDGMPGREVKTARHIVQGEPIAFLKANGQASGPVAAAVASPHPDNTVLIIQVMQQQAAAQQAASDRQMTMMMAMMEQSRQAAAQQAAMQIESMRAFASMMAGQRQDPTAMLTAAAQMASSQVQAITAVMPKPETAKDPMDQLKTILEVSEKIKGGGKKGETLSEFMEGMGPVLQGVAMMEQNKIEAAKAGVSLAAPGFEGPKMPPATPGPAQGEEKPAPQPNGTPHHSEAAAMGDS
jgi:hypothetical protein